MREKIGIIFSIFIKYSDLARYIKHAYDVIKLYVKRHIRLRINSSNFNI